MKRHGSDLDAAGRCISGRLVCHRPGIVNKTFKPKDEFEPPKMFRKKLRKGEWTTKKLRLICANSGAGRNYGTAGYGRKMTTCKHVANGQTKRKTARCGVVDALVRLKDEEAPSW